MSTSVPGGARRIVGRRIPGGARRIPASPWTRTIAVLLIPVGLALLLASAAGCSKHEWLSQKRAGVEPGTVAHFDSTGRALPTRAAQGTAPSRPGDSAIDRRAPDSGPPPENPAVMGGLAAPAPEDAISELRWEPTSPAGVSPPGREVPSVDCSAGPCYWIQVAALADSSGAATALASAGALASRAGVAPSPPGGSVLNEAGLWKVRLGPWARWEDAEAALRAVRSGGFGGAWLVRHGGNSG